MFAPRGRARFTACVAAALCASPVTREAASTPRAARLAPAPVASVTQGFSLPPEPPAPPPGTLERVGPPTAPDYAVRPLDTSAPRGVTVYLHGLCGGPINGCGYFRHLVVGEQWLVCPTAPTACGAGASWTAPALAQHRVIERAINRASHLPGAPAIDRAEPGVLIGFSQGTYAAMTRLRTERGRWRAVAFIAGYISPTRAQLESYGVRRVLFAAGRYDGTARTLRESARRLRSEGFEARFLDLGPVGHTFVAHRSSEGWQGALAWLHATE